MKSITDKQVGMLLWMVQSGNLSNYLKPRVGEVQGHSVDYTQADFEKWLEANITCQQATDLISTMLNDHISPEDIFELFLNNHNYNRQTYEVAR